MPRPFGARSTCISWATGPTMRANSSHSPRMNIRRIPGRTTTPGLCWRPIPPHRDVVAKGHSAGAQAPRSRRWVWALSRESDSPPDASVKTWRGLTIAPGHRCGPYDK